MRAAIMTFALLAPVVARAESEAERLYNQGQQAYDASRFDDAVVAWTQSYALSKLPALLFNIAQAQRLRARPGDCTKATANYRKFIAALPKSPQRPTAEGFLAELAPCVEREAQPPPSLPPAPQPVIEPPPPQQPLAPMPAREGGGGKRIAGYAFAGAGVALVATGVYFGAKARRLGDEVSDECRDGCDWNLVKDKDAEGKSAETTQYILYGVGAGAIAVGGVLWWLGNKERSSVTVTPTAGGGAVTWSGTW